MNHYNREYSQEEFDNFGLWQKIKKVIKKPFEKEVYRPPEQVLQMNPKKAGQLPEDIEEAKLGIRPYNNRVQEQGIFMPSKTVQSIQFQSPLVAKIQNPKERQIIEELKAGEVGAKGQSSNPEKADEDPTGKIFLLWIGGLTLAVGCAIAIVHYSNKAKIK